MLSPLLLETEAWQVHELQVHTGTSALFWRGQAWSQGSHLPVPISALHGSSQQPQQRLWVLLGAKGNMLWSLRGAQVVLLDGR